MARPVNPNPPTRLHTVVSPQLRAKLDLHLFSDVEGRVPKGAYQEFFETRIQEFFTYRRLDLAPFGFPPGYFVQGPKEIIEALIKRLQEESK